MATRRLTLAIALACAMAGTYLVGDVIHWTRVDGSAPRENIVSEAIALRATTRGFQIDVSDIVNKHIVPDEDRANVVRYLTGLGFEIRFQLATMDGAEVLTALRTPLERTLGSYMFALVYDELRITVHFFEGRVFGPASGEIVYRYP